eukprot:2536286-Amphidinium_carterae.2
MKVYPRLRERLEEQPHVKLPTEQPAPPPAAPARVADTDAPFQLWIARRNPVQRTRVGTFTFSLRRLQLLARGYPMGPKRVLWQLTPRGPKRVLWQRFGLRECTELKSTGGRAGAAEVELTLAGSAAKDPQKVADVGLVRTWDRWIQRGGEWPPSSHLNTGMALWPYVLSALAEFAQRVKWQPGRAGWNTPRGFVPWCQASATAAQDSQAWTLGQVAARRQDFKGLENGLDPVDTGVWHKLSSKSSHAGSAACSAAAGGLWHAARLAEVFEHDGKYGWCLEEAARCITCFTTAHFGSRPDGSMVFGFMLNFSCHGLFKFLNRMRHLVHSKLSLSLRGCCSKSNG